MLSGVLTGSVVLDEGNSTDCSGNGRVGGKLVVDGTGDHNRLPLLSRMVLEEERTVALRPSVQ
jgi:hypothetical protein